MNTCLACTYEGTSANEHVQSTNLDQYWARAGNSIGSLRARQVNEDVFKVFKSDMEVIDNLRPVVECGRNRTRMASKGAHY